MDAKSPPILEPVVDVVQLVKSFARRNGVFRSESHAEPAVNHVSFEISQGESLAIVGESGAGKSTVARCVLGIERPTSGSIKLFGEDITSRSGVRRVLRRDIQPVFQDPRGTLNPRWTVSKIITEPLKLLTEESATDITARAEPLLRSVGLQPELLGRYRHQLSGGQQQRVSIARAISVRPRCLVLDEPFASLDALVKRDLVSLLADLRRSANLSILMITHDLRTAPALSDRILVMLRGRVVELGPTTAVMQEPLHPYTRLLIESRMNIPGERSRKRTDPTSSGIIREFDDNDLQDPSQMAIGPLCEKAPGRYVAQVP